MDALTIAIQSLEDRRCTKPHVDQHPLNRFSIAFMLTRLHTQKSERERERARSSVKFRVGTILTVGKLGFLGVEDGGLKQSAEGTP